MRIKIRRIEGAVRVGVKKKTEGTHFTFLGINISGHGLIIILFNIAFMFLKND